ncbi:hypothetical protein UFOVP46_81 [uncultured Caudovirales phage]|uniref:Uncharacterized protein n=1 Tax=uncultured Caudovirales phage TaxID=2100421 RepID=A0A6J5KR29_9CAUD|nr:hypothetical protein UFOVP46_81 [uncultured Caudovirales phage]
MSAKSASKSVLSTKSCVEYADTIPVLVTTCSKPGKSSSTMNDRKEIQLLVKQATKQGWIVSRTGSDHIKWLPPNGMEMIISSSSPSDYRTIRWLKRDLRVRGFIEVTKQKGRR